MLEPGRNTATNQLSGSAPAFIMNKRLLITTTVKRKWASYCWNAKRTACGWRSFVEQVTQHDVQSVGNWVFWRGARIAPGFPRRKKNVEDVRKTI